MRRRSLTGLQERFEASELGRAVIGAFVAVTLAVILIANLPTSELKRQLVRVAEPYLEATGIHQVWGVFAPDPRRTVLFLEARVRFADGSTSTWRPPDGLPFPDSYRDVRWRKWADAVATSQDYWEPAARWVARRYAGGASSVTSVELIARTYELLPPGNEPSRAPSVERTIHRLELADPPAA